MYVQMWTGRGWRVAGGEVLVLLWLCQVLTPCDELHEPFATGAGADRVLCDCSLALFAGSALKACVSVAL